MSPVGFEPTISAGERPKTYALDRTATGTGNEIVIIIIKSDSPTCLLSLVRNECVPTLTLHTNSHIFRQHFTADSALICCIFNQNAYVFLGLGFCLRIWLTLFSFPAPAILLLFCPFSVLLLCICTVLLLHLCSCAGFIVTRVLWRMQVNEQLLNWIELSSALLTPLPFCNRVAV